MFDTMAFSFPASTPCCPGCIDGTCTSNYGMAMTYLSYYDGTPDEMAGPYGPEFNAYGYDAPVFFCQPAPPFLHGQQPYHQPQRQGSWQKGRRGTFTKKNSFNAQHPPFHVPISSALESAIMTVKMDPQANLFSIDGRIAEVAVSNDGACRFIQDRIRVGSEQEVGLALRAALASFGLLWMDYRGNRVLQALFVSGSRDVRKELLAMIHRVGPLNMSMNKHGCRVIQSAVTSIDNEDLIELVSKFQGQVLTLIHDPNGNHVVQRIIESTNKSARLSEARGDDESASSLTAQLQFVVDDVIEYVESLSVHSYGCRVVQRALEFCNNDQKNAVLNAVMKCKDKLMKDQFGNYVLQQAIATGNENTRDVIFDCIIKGSGPESLLILSKHKYASNVVEKFIQLGSMQQREMIIKESLKPREGDVCIAVEMAKDNNANYVIKTAIEYAHADQKRLIFDELSKNFVELSKYPQASYIFSKESGSVSSLPGQSSELD